MSFDVRILQAKKDESGVMPQCFTGIGPETLETLWGLIGAVASIHNSSFPSPLSFSISLSFSIPFASMIWAPIEWAHCSSSLITAIRACTPASVPLGVVCTFEAFLPRKPALIWELVQIWNRILICSLLSRMTFRERVKRVFHSKPDGPVKPKIEYYRRHECPPSKFKGPFDRAHQKRLAAWSFEGAMVEKTRSLDLSLSPSTCDLNSVSPDSSDPADLVASGTHSNLILDLHTPV